MSVNMSDRDIAISYIGLLKRENCQKIMLLLNSYWADAAFENATLDYRKVWELCKTIRSHVGTMVNICPAQPIISDKVESQKRWHPSNIQVELKKRRMDESSLNSQMS